MSSKAIGIDLGTTNTVCGVYYGNTIKIIPNIGQNLTPSFIGFEESLEFVLLLFSKLFKSLLLLLFSE